MTTGELTAAQKKNVDLVWRMSGVIADDGYDALVERYDEFFHPDFVASRKGLGEERFEGRSGIVAYGDDLAAMTSSYEIRPTEARAMDDEQVLVVGDVDLVGAQSGAATEGSYGAIYRVIDGRIKSGHLYFPRAEAERAADAQA